MTADLSWRDLIDWDGTTPEIVLCDTCGRHIPCRRCKPLDDEGPDCGA